MTVTTCAWCEYFDGGGLARVEVAHTTGERVAGDCHNPASGRFTTDSDDTCPAFYPDTTPAVPALLSKDLDRLATGPLPLNSRVHAPRPGERCHRCHQRAPNLNGCALCYPEGIPRKATDVDHR